MANEKDKPFYVRAEEWIIEENLHIWLGVISLIAGSVLVFALHNEHNKNQFLMKQNIELSEQLSLKDSEIHKLSLQVADKEMSLEPKPLEATINKTANKLQSKIEKVETSVINNRPVIKQTEVKVIEKEAKINNELKNIMNKSFCYNFPQDPSCKKGSLK